MPATPFCPVKRPEVYIVGTQPVGACPLHGGGRQGVTYVAGWETPSPARPASSADDPPRAAGSEGDVSEAAMARRAAELVGLDPQDCLQKAAEGYYLRFTVGKANIGNRRIKVDRPISDFAVQALRLLLRAQEGLQRITGTLPASPVFSLPHYSRARLSPATDKTVRDTLDRFCDFFEIPLDKQGRRYYLRTHQLRRFFAMMFFWHFGFGGMDTLRYMLAQVDFAHVWRYITENVPGKVLAQVKTTFVTTKLREGSADTQSLGALLQKEYGIANFAILSEETVERYVADLIAKGLVDVKPEFLDDKHEWKILVQIRRRP